MIGEEGGRPIQSWKSQIGLVCHGWIQRGGLALHLLLPSPTRSWQQLHLVILTMGGYNRLYPPMEHIHERRLTTLCSWNSSNHAWLDMLHGWIHPVVSTRGRITKMELMPASFSIKMFWRCSTFFFLLRCSGDAPPSFSFWRCSGDAWIRCLNIINIYST